MSTRIMHDIIIVLKSLALICITWFSELLISSFITLSFVPVNVREFFIETKEILAWLVSFTILILTIIKIKRELKNKKNN